MEQRKAEKIILVKLTDGVTLVGETTTDRGDDPISLKDELVLKKVLMLSNMASFKELEDGLLEEVTEADQIGLDLKTKTLRNIPMLNIPDEALVTSSTFNKALDKQWPIAYEAILVRLEVDPTSLIGRFYIGTLKYLRKDKKTVSRLFSACDTKINLLEGVYNDTKTSKYFKVRG